jgi:uncharacterized lipoprotein YehR (DUF1307 family)
MKKHLTVLLIILGLSFMVAGCSDKENKDNKPMLTNPNDDVPVP